MRGQLIESFLFLSESGAVYAPCMRDDVFINTEYAAQGLADTLDLGCCEVDVENRRIAGTTSKAECEISTNGLFSIKIKKILM